MLNVGDLGFRVYPFLLLELKKRGVDDASWYVYINPVHLKFVFGKMMLRESQRTQEQMKEETSTK